MKSPIAGAPDPETAKVIRGAVTAGYVDRVPTLEPDGLITDGLRLTVKGRDALALLMLVCPKDELEALARAALPGCLVAPDQRLPYPTGTGDHL